MRILLMYEEIRELATDVNLSYIGMDVKEWIMLLNNGTKDHANLSKNK